MCAQQQALKVKTLQASQENHDACKQHEQKLHERQHKLSSVSSMQNMQQRILVMQAQDILLLQLHAATAS